MRALLLSLAVFGLARSAAAATTTELVELVRTEVGRDGLDATTGAGTLVDSDVLKRHLDRAITDGTRVTSACKDASPERGPLGVDFEACELTFTNDNPRIRLTFRLKTRKIVAPNAKLRLTTNMAEVDFE